MKLDVGMPDLKGMLAAEETAIARDLTGAMRESLPLTKQELREQMVSAGLGARLANTWRGETYPGSKVSLEPAGYIWSNAPDLVDAFTRGATIKPVGGSDYLWLPTKNVPRARGRVGRSGKNLKGGAMTPDEVENRFNTDFIVRPGKNGTLLAFMDVTRSMNARGFRRSTAGRARQGRRSEPILMFVLRKSVTMPKLLDLDRPAQGWADHFQAAFGRRSGAA